VHQGYLEPHAVVASLDPVDDTLTVYTSTQGVLSTRNGTARLLGVDRDKVRVVPMTVGGGFGAKYGIFEPLAGAAALALRRPVKLVLTRSEDFGATTPAPGVVSTIELGAAADGTLLAIRADIAVESGSFSSGMAGIVANLVGSAYRCANLDISAREILVNKAMMGAYRAPGSPQAFYILETAIDELTRKLGVDPLEFRLANASVTGDPMADDKPWPSIGITTCLEAVRDHPLWKGRHDLAENRGVGLAVGGFPGGTHPAAALCRADSDGTFYVHVGSVDLTGTNSAMALITAEIIGISPEDVTIVQGDSSTNPVSGPAGGSMTTYTVGAAVAEAAEGARAQILELASQMLEAAVDDLDIEEGIVKVKGSPGSEISVKKIAGSTVRFGGGNAPITAQGRSAITTQAPGFTAQLVEVEIDPETGELDVLRDIVFQDVGRALNPPLVEAQIHGGAAQGLSWAILEDMSFDESGQLNAGNLSSYLLPEATQVPVIEAVMLDNPAPEGPLGARGVGEPPITAGPAAVANAVRDAAGVRVLDLPLTPERIWRAIQSGKPSAHG
jgi:CO/xanthine dehydrogenase Mo-binding subunit